MYSAIHRYMIDHLRRCLAVSQPSKTKTTTSAGMAAAWRGLRHPVAIFLVDRTRNQRVPDKRGV